MTTLQGLKIVTLNTWQKCGPWEQRWEAIARQLLDYQPDVIAFQELFDAEWCNHIARRAAYPFVSAPLPTRSGLVLLSRLPITASALHAFSARSPLESYGRYLLSADVVGPRGKLLMFNTHLSWMAEDGATRLAQVKEILQHLESRRNGQPMLVMGDLNAPPDSEEIRWLLENGKLVDTFAALHPYDEGHTWCEENCFTRYQQPNLPDRRIDYVLAHGEDLVRGLSSCRTVFKTATADGIFPSDHFGVIAEFSFQAP